MTLPEFLQSHLAAHYVGMLVDPGPPFKGPFLVEQVKVEIEPETCRLWTTLSGGDSALGFDQLHELPIRISPTT